VLTENGQPLDKVKFEYHFRKACRQAKISGFTFHDLRHCAISRWAADGVPVAAAMLAAGHSSVASHKRYQNLTHSDLKAGFGIAPNCSRAVHREKNEGLLEGTTT
jgi:integrase